jgi:putative transposase
MSAWLRFPDHGYPSLLTTNVEDRRPIFRDGMAAEMLLEVIGEVQHEEAFELHSYVIMPDHVHLVVTVPIGRSLGRIVQLIKGRFAWRYNRAKGATGKVWQDRYHERGLRSDREFHVAVEYVHKNPVAADLVQEVGKYPWSSASRPFPVRLRA